jgi:hypothetical protein
MGSLSHPVAIREIDFKESESPEPKREGWRQRGGPNAVVGDGEY